MFNRKQTEPRKIDENLGDLECEEAIISDKTRFGRVRKYTMKYLRAKYGRDVADRAQWRVNRRKTKDYFRNQK
jgi:hypothetical protein